MSLGVAALFHGRTLTDAKKEVAVKGVVEGGSGQQLANATICLIPSADVAGMVNTPNEIKKDAINFSPSQTSKL